MSSVSSSDGGYKHYARSVTELEEDYDNQLKKIRKDTANEIKNLEETQGENLKKTEAKADETVENVRENSQEVVARERALAQREVKKLKQETYDRLGRYGDDSLTQQQVKILSKANNELVSESSRSLDSTREAYSTKMADREDAHAKQLEEVAEKSRADAMKMYNEYYNDERGAYKDIRKGVEEKYAALSQEQVKDANDVRREAMKKVEEAERNAEIRVKKVREKEDVRLADQARGAENKITKNLEGERWSRKNEVAELASSVSEITDLKKKALKESNEARARAIADYDDYWRSREKATQDSYTGEISKIKGDLRDIEGNLNKRYSQRMRERDAQFTEQFGNQTREHRDSVGQLRSDFAREREHSEKAVAHERQLTAEAMERQQENSRATMENAMGRQGESYQSTIQNQRDGYQDQIKRLETKITTKETTSDPNEISPAAEAAVRRTVTEEYEKTLGAYDKKNAESANSIRTEYSQRMKDLVRENEKSRTDFNRRVTADRNVERVQLLDTLADQEQMSQKTMQEQESTHLRENVKINKSYTNAMDRQRQQYDELFQTVKTDAESKQARLLQENDFREKMMHRKFTTDFSQMAREYEKRLSDQKETYDAAMEEQRLASDKTIRDTERRAQMELEAQSKSYQQQIAQNEHQQKERERIVSQNFQDELDRVRHTNAQLMRKKG